jgi:hypothetical protein
MVFAVIIFAPGTSAWDIKKISILFLVRPDIRFIDLPELPIRVKLGREQ